MAKLSFWLIPAATERAFFQELICTLAQQYDAPVFVPHVTIYVSESTPQDDPQAILTRAVAGVPPFRLHVEKIAFSAVFTRTLFVQFYASDTLRALAARVRAGLARPSPYALHPHLSLLYKHMETETKRRLAASLRLPSATVFFDTVGVMVAPAETRTPEDVERWQLVCERRLHHPGGRRPTPRTGG